MRTVRFLIVALAASCIAGPAAAEDKPDDTVRCGLNGAEFYTKRAICNVLIDEAVVINNSYGGISKIEMVHECAKHLGRRLPGKDQTVYLNQCDGLVSLLWRH